MGLFDFFKADPCKCGKPGEAPHYCPYQEELSDVPLEEQMQCNCCVDCARECAYDI